MAANDNSPSDALRAAHVTAWGARDAALINERASRRTARWTFAGIVLAAVLGGLIQRRCASPAPTCNVIVRTGEQGEQRPAEEIR